MPTESHSGPLQIHRSSSVGAPSLAEVEPLLQKVARVHGDHNPRLHGVAAAFEALKAAGDAAARGAALARIREEADGFTTPAWGCRSYRLLMEQLAALEQQHRAAGA